MPSAFREARRKNPSRVRPRHPPVYSRGRGTTPSGANSKSEARNPKEEKPRAAGATARGFVSDFVLRASDLFLGLRLGEREQVGRQRPVEGDVRLLVPLVG